MNRSKQIFLLKALAILAVLTALLIFTADAEASSTISGVSGGTNKAYNVYKDLVKTVAGKFIVFALAAGAAFTTAERGNWTEFSKHFAFAAAIGVVIIFIPEIVNEAFSTGACV